MGSVLALVRASWLTARSYRVRMLVSVLSLVATIVPLFFIANALQPVMEGAIRDEGGQYFGFLLIGMVTFLLLPAAVNALPTEVGSGINTGVLEALLGTPARLPALLAGLVGFNLLWTALRAAILLTSGWMLGAELLWPRIGAGVLILAMIVAAYLPIGMFAAAMVIAFRTAGPLPQAVLGISALLGGVYYPTSVIPSWIQGVSDWVPLTYGLRALRATVMDGASLAQVSGDLGVLGLFAVALTSTGSLALSVALRHARRAGTLAHY